MKENCPSLKKKYRVIKQLGLKTAIKNDTYRYFQRDYRELEEQMIQSQNTTVFVVPLNSSSEQFAKTIFKK